MSRSSRHARLRAGTALTAATVVVGALGLGVDGAAILRTRRSGESS